MDENIIHSIIENMEKAVEHIESSDNLSEGIQTLLNEETHSESVSAEELLNHCRNTNVASTAKKLGSRIVDAATKKELAVFFGRMNAIIEHGNRNIMRAATKNGGGINMNPSLSGYLFEEMHAAIFNAKAVASGSNMRAFVKKPSVGKGFAKNSVDIILKDMKTGKEYRFQAKCCQDAKATIQAIKSGDYRNQRLLVPENQVEDVQKAFPNKTVTDKLSSDGVESNPISASRAKNTQEALQNGQPIELNLGAVDFATYVRAYVELIKEPAIISFGIHMASGILSEAFSEDFKISRLLKNVAVGTGEDVLVLSAAYAAIIELGKNGIKIAAENTTYVVDIARCIYDVTKAVVMMATDMISIEEGMAVITEAITETALIILGTKVGATVGTAINPGAGSVIGSIIGGIVAGIAGTMISEKTKTAVVEFCQNIIAKHSHQNKAMVTA